MSQRRDLAAIPKQPNYQKGNNREEKRGNDADSDMDRVSIGHANQKAPPRYNPFHLTPRAECPQVSTPIHPLWRPDAGRTAR
jgi:hypothetical protein